MRADQQNNYPGLDGLYVEDAAMEQENHLGSPQPDKPPQTCENVSLAFPAKKLDAGREAAGVLVHTVDTMPPRPRGDLSPRPPAAGSE
ncbi:MAG: hypothetical protein ACKPKO_55770, partial [Candidatus Fonsibacter sp.]